MRLFMVLLMSVMLGACAQGDRRDRLSSGPAGKISAEKTREQPGPSARIARHARPDKQRRPEVARLHPGPSAPVEQKPVEQKESRDPAEQAPNPPVEEPGHGNPFAHVRGTGDIQGLQPVYFATNRRVTEQSLGTYAFSPRRGRQLTYGLTIVTVPKNHLIGNVERPRFNYLIGRYEPERDAEDFRLRSVATFTRESFVEELRMESGGVLLFIHGYNTSFEDAIFKAAQIAYDANFDGNVVAFSWPSAGTLFGYQYDRDSAEFSALDLLALLRILTEEVGRKPVYVVAHSLGNLALVNALERAAITKLNMNISELVMAAPDVDKDLFMEKAAEIKSVAKYMTLYASSADKALLASGKQAWDTRMGYIGDGGPNLVEGIDTIDVTAVGDDMLGLNHGTYSGNRSVLTDLARLIRSSAHMTPIDRTPTLRFIPDKAHVQYWQFPK